MALWTFYNNGFVREADCRVPAGDLAIQRGYGIFDFFKTRAGQPVFLDDHLERFYQSAETMRLPVGRTPAALKAIIQELLQKNGFADSGVRLTLTGGVSPNGYALGNPISSLPSSHCNYQRRPLLTRGLNWLRTRTSGNCRM